MNSWWLVRRDGCDVAHDDAVLRDIQRALDDETAAHRATARDLQHALDAVETAHQATRSEIERLGQEVSQLADGLDSLKEKFTAFVEEDRLARNMQFAQTALIDVRAQRDRQFGHYEAVRRGTIGMLQAMDAGIVTESALQQASERRMLDTPGYWLAPAQVALAAWIRDSKALANRALLEAMAREPNKTALFFSLVLARHERYNAAGQWLYEYVGRQKPTALSREFTVVLDAVAQDALGGRARQVVWDRCITWSDQLALSEDIVREQSLRWQQRLSRNQRSVADRFRVLADVSPDWETMASWLDAATVHGQTERWLRDLLETTVVPPEDLRQRVDGVLRTLVTAYDEDENFLRRREMKWDSIVKHRGDHATAAQALEDDSPQEESPVNLMTLFTTIAITPDQVEASPPLRQAAIRFAGQWIAAAAQELSRKSRRENPGSIRVKIGNWTGELTPDSNDDDAVMDLGNFIDREVRVELGQITVRKPVIIFFVMLAFVALLLPALIVQLFALIVMLPVEAIAFLSAVFSYFYLRRSRSALPERREEVRKRGEARKRASQVKLRQAADEVRQVFELWAVELAKEGSLVDFIREQNARTTPLSLPAVAAQHAVTGSAEPVDGTLDTAGGTPENTGRQPHDAESFALTLPDWDLMPPSHGH